MKFWNRTLIINRTGKIIVFGWHLYSYSLLQTGVLLLQFSFFHFAGFKRWNDKLFDKRNWNKTSISSELFRQRHRYSFFRRWTDRNYLFWRGHAQPSFHKANWKNTFFHKKKLPCSCWRRNHPGSQPGWYWRWEIKRLEKIGYQSLEHRHTIFYRKRFTMDE